MESEEKHRETRWISLPLSVYIISLLLSFTFYVLPRSLSTFYFLHYLVLVTGPRDRSSPTGSDFLRRTLRIYMKRTPCCWPSRTKIIQDPGVIPAGLALQQIRLQSSGLLWEGTSRLARSPVVPCSFLGETVGVKRWVVISFHHLVGLICPVDFERCNCICMYLSLG